jgi:hypothetical protein
MCFSRGRGFNFTLIIQSTQTQQATIFLFILTSENIFCPTLHVSLPTAIHSTWWNNWRTRLIISTSCTRSNLYFSMSYLSTFLLVLSTFLLSSAWSIRLKLCHRPVLQTKIILKNFTCSRREGNWSVQVPVSWLSTLFLRHYLVALEEGITVRFNLFILFHSGLAEIPNSVQRIKISKKNFYSVQWLVGLKASSKAHHIEILNRKIGIYKQNKSPDIYIPQMHRVYPIFST